MMKENMNTINETMEIETIETINDEKKRINVKSALIKMLVGILLSVSIVSSVAAVYTFDKYQKLYQFSTDTVEILEETIDDVVDKYDIDNNEVETIISAKQNEYTSEIDNMRTIVELEDFNEFIGIYK